MKFVIFSDFFQKHKVWVSRISVKFIFIVQVIIFLIFIFFKWVNYKWGIFRDRYSVFFNFNRAIFSSRNTLFSKAVKFFKVNFRIFLIFFFFIFQLLDFFFQAFLLPVFLLFSFHLYPLFFALKFSFFIRPYINKQIFLSKIVIFFFSNLSFKLFSSF